MSIKNIFREQIKYFNKKFLNLSVNLKYLPLIYKIFTLKYNLRLNILLILILKKKIKK
jgi:hypothetical protein